MLLGLARIKNIYRQSFSQDKGTRVALWATQKNESVSGLRIAPGVGVPHQGALCRFIGVEALCYS
jgi:hypothetical protein